MEFVINGRFLTQRTTGVQRYAHELARALDAILDTEPDNKITILSPRLMGAPPVWRNILLHQVGRLQGHAWEQFELPWYSGNATLFCPGNTAPAVSLLRKQRVVVTLHDLSYLYFPEAYSNAFRAWYGMIIPLILSRADQIITVSESERCAILSHYPKAAPRLHAIQNGGLPGNSNLKEIGSAAEDSNFVLYVGSLSKRKNFPGVLEAACRLARKRNIRFVFIGGATGGISSGNMEIPSDVAGQITMTGQMDDSATLISYYRRAACFLFPSFYEASPLPPIEAMACGCPVIASDIPSLRERCGDAAVYCDPHDIDSICASVLQIMDNTDLRSSLQALGYQRAANYTWEACARSMLDVIKQMPRHGGAG
jgi:glycosyltransferase involved in cell wall biosynthesis